MDESRVASIRLSVAAIATYAGYVFAGVALGVCALFVVAQHLPRDVAGAASSLCIYSAAVFAHFRFAHGESAWRKPELGAFVPTLCWAILMVVIGSLAIGVVQGSSSRIFAGDDDATHLRKLNSVFADSVRGGHAWRSLLMLVETCVIAPIAEELLFRSGLYRILKGRTSTTAAALLSSAVFSATHLSVVAFFPLLLLGYLCCWVYEKTGDIRGPMIFHSGYNFLILFAAARTPA